MGVKAADVAETAPYQTAAKPPWLSRKIPPWSIGGGGSMIL